MPGAQLPILVAMAVLACAVPTASRAADFDCGSKPTLQCVASHLFATSRTFVRESNEDDHALRGVLAEVAGRIPVANDQIELLIKIAETLLPGPRN